MRLQGDLRRLPHFLCSRVRIWALMSSIFSLSVISLVVIEGDLINSDYRSMFGVIMYYIKFR